MPHTAPTGPRWPAWVEEWVLPFVHERALWPVWFAILGHVVLVFAMGVLSALRGSGFGVLGACTVVTLGVIGWEIRVIRRPGALALSLGLTWAAAIALVLLAMRTGVL